jgi:hypothetical protein
MLYIEDGVDNKYLVPTVTYLTKFSHNTKILHVHKTVKKLHNIWMVKL